MPQKNTLKVYAADSYYHVYSRGTNKQRIFETAADYAYFEGLFERYLSREPKLNSNGVSYPNYHAEIQMLAYCLMPNHCHMLLYQTDDSEAISAFMRSLMTSYSKYFNRKYKRVGTLFESRYKAKRIDNDAYLLHIGRYIHMNPRHWQTWRHSSLRYVYGAKPPEWLRVAAWTEQFKGRADYLRFLNDYQSQKDALEEIKHELANK